MSKFQLFILIIFGIFLVGGVIVFSIYRGNSTPTANVTIWGSISQIDFENILSDNELTQNKQVQIKYQYVPEEDFDAKFVEALAAGQGPDLFVLSSDKIMKHSNKAYVVPFSAYTERTFKDSFIEGSEIFTTPKGVLALPIAVDPLVMYWNRSIFTTAKVTVPPKYWDEFYNLANQISQKDGASWMYTVAEDKTVTYVPGAGSSFRS
jgi:multiple sugar transport system substrate-binding protein